MYGDLNRSHLEMMLLAILEDESLHGYTIIKELHRRSGGAFETKEGTLYPALHRLEEAGLINGKWSTSEGRRRRTYSLTRVGRAELDEQRKQWHGFSRAVDRVMRGA